MLVRFYEGINVLSFFFYFLELFEKICKLLSCHYCTDCWERPRVAIENPSTIIYTRVFRVFVPLFLCKKILSSEN